VNGDSIFLRSIKGDVFEEPSEKNKYSFAKKLRVLSRINDAVASFHEIKYLNSKCKISYISNIRLGR